MNSQNISNRARLKCVEIAQKSTGCHLGGSLSVVDILSVLFCEFYRTSNNDVIILSKGHAAAALYSVLYECGYVKEDPAKSYGQKESLFTGHPNNKLQHIRFATGSLGHGPALGLGWALGQRAKGGEGVAYVVMGDGELQEGSCWEAFQIAVSLNVENLTYIVDRNRAQNDGWVDSVISLGDIDKKASAFGLKTVSIDGHNFDELRSAIGSESEKTPKFIVANTTKGKGVRVLENNIKSHYVKIDLATAHAWQREVANGFGASSVQK